MTTWCKDVQHLTSDFIEMFVPFSGREDANLISGLGRLGSVFLQHCWFAFLPMKSICFVPLLSFRLSHPKVSAHVSVTYSSVSRTRAYTAIFQYRTNSTLRLCLPSTSRHNITCLQKPITDSSPQVLTTIHHYKHAGMPPHKDYCCWRRPFNSRDLQLEVQQRWPAVNPEILKYQYLVVLLYQVFASAPYGRVE